MLSEFLAVDPMPSPNMQVFINGGWVEWITVARLILVGPKALIICVAGDAAVKLPTGDAIARLEEPVGCAHRCFEPTLLVSERLGRTLLTGKGFEDRH